MVGDAQFEDAHTIGVQSGGYIEVDTHGKDLDFHRLFTTSPDRPLRSTGPALRFGYHP